MFCWYTNLNGETVCITINWFVMFITPILSCMLNHTTAQNFPSLFSFIGLHALQSLPTFLLKIKACQDFTLKKKAGTLTCLGVIKNFIYHTILQPSYPLSCNFYFVTVTSITIYTSRPGLIRQGAPYFLIAPLCSPLLA